ncbi:mitochondrial inner membrane protease subunit 2 isoform X2 [Eurytemora carolleeae]|uniref:mitochondrial inner membrane protease subunit 2 isoform X2 n=1 Tax=Eurytemora carolleeae TaxID=1294199 RepID=UPI000C78996A|nr:mitochondrial inner membrane protease subunit 2 isoform X2 [Eurytemora carolleeae]|eukprot:XP_023319570.1 mitochondrial inner membrane protease subunit 2-like isoform X2 [Eurytemora affinis]
MSSIAKRGANYLYGKLLKPLAIGSIKFGIGAGLYYNFDQVGCLRTVNGPSMSPTLNPQLKNYYSGIRTGRLDISNELVFISRNLQKLERGDIVLLDRPNRDNDRLVKRVVAVEGDTITPFGVGSTVRAPVKLGPGEVWVESDGGPGYLGSSVFGSVPISCIKGIAKAAICIGATSDSYFFFRFLAQEIPAHVQPNLVINRPIPTVQEETVPVA